MKHLPPLKYTVPAALSFSAAAILLAMPAGAVPAPATWSDPPAAVSSAPAASAAPVRSAPPSAAPKATIKAAQSEAEPAAENPKAAPAKPAAAAKEAPAPADPAADRRLEGLAANKHTVASGDTVGTIAAFYGVDAASMLAANGLGFESVILPGQDLKLTGPPVKAEAPAPQAAQSKTVPAPAEKERPVAAPAVRTISIAGSGGQEMIDRCIGPIHFTPLSQYAVFITEHDFCGGWARFSGIVTGETVTVSGFGTYTVKGIGTVPQGGSTGDVVGQFGYMPSVILQTCIPGTNQMRVIALG